MVFNPPIQIHTLMKYNSIKLFPLVLFILFNTHGSFGQQPLVRPVIRSSVISFSDIVKNNLEHPDTSRKQIENIFEDKEEEVIPNYDVLDSAHVKKDPYGRIVSSINIPVNAPYGKAQTNTILSVAPSVNFNAIDDNNTSIPPDVNGAVGPNHIMTTLNTQVRIQNLTGGIISTVSLNGFWASLGNPGVFDPKILYEPFNNRWIFSAAANGQSTTSAVLIGVSQTNDPTGLWNLYSIDADAPNVNWFDYPSLGYNKDWIVVTGNLFTISGNSFVTGKVYIFKKADLYAHVVSPLVTVLTPGANYFTLSPTATYDNSISTLYLLQRVNGNSGGSGFLNLYTITGAIGSETLSAPMQFSTPNPWSSSASATNSAPQSGSAQKIAVNDDRVQNAVYRNGSIWGIHTVFLPAGAPTRSAVQWWQVSTAGAILQRGRIDDATGVQFFGFPSIAVNINSDALIGYAKFSASIFASGCYALRASTDPVNTFQSEFLFKAGLAPYFKTFSGTSNRWGDYTATMTDPTGLDFWTVQEYAALPSGGSDRWGTWWAKIAGTPCVPPNPVSVSIAASPAGAICSGTSVTFTATPTNPGTTPTYQWQKNGTNVGISSTTYTDNALTNGNQITCILTSNINCPTGNPATSNTITMTVNVVDDFNACTTDVCNTSTGTVTHNPISVDDGNACTTDACTNTITSSTITSSGASGLPLTWASTTPSIPSFDFAFLTVAGFPAGSQITNASVSVNLNHTWGGDLQLYLEHPNTINFVGLGYDPTDSRLLYGSNSGNGPTLPYSFTSTGSTMNILANPNTANPVPSPGPYKPVDGAGVPTTFGTFNALNPNGTWKIYIGDGVAGDGGTVELFSLTITANSAVAVITHTPVNTNDGNPCTTDACNTSTGAVTHTAVSVDDGNACTTDACNSGTGAITHTQVSTNDGNPCTTDGCNSISGIFHNPVNTDDSNVCTTDACNTSTGAITHTQVPTDDGNACTTDGCNSISGIFHNPVSTDDGNACTTDGCNSISGIFHNPVTTDDGNVCTTDDCNTSTGAITHTQVPTDDGNACTIDGCNSISGIFHNPVTTNDGNVCTDDGCNTSTGVFHNPVSTDDGNACTTDGCNSISGIFHNPVTIDDGNACTDDGCNTSTGVFHNPVTTDDGNACTNDGCNTSTGVFHNPVITDDGNVCTTDACNTSNGDITHTPISVDDGIACTTDGCNSLTGIFHTSVNCAVTLNSNIIIEGYYNSVIGLMNNAGPGGCLFVTGKSGDPTDADTIFISAMNPSTPFAEVDRQKGILKTNGNVSVSFGPAVFAGNNYYLKVNHRNSVETWSAAPVLLSSTTTYLFSSASSQAFSSNEIATPDNLYFAIYSGDINDISNPQDGAVDGSDFLVWDPSNQNGDGGYVPADLNGDGAVDGTDFLVWDPNNQNGIGFAKP